MTSFTFCMHSVYLFLSLQNCIPYALRLLQFRGGERKQNEMVVYNTNSKSFRSYGDNFLGIIGNGNGERGQGSVFYTQINNTTLFIISQTDNFIHVYDLNPETLSFHTLEPAIPGTVGDLACLASSEVPSPRLYITGGYHNTNDVFEVYAHFWNFDLEEYSWNRSVDMNHPRYGHGCIVVNDTLWVMGTVPQFESINMMDIHHSEWTMDNELLFPNALNLSNFGVVEWNHSIYIIGGWDNDEGYNSDTVYIFSTKTGNMMYDTLPFGVSSLSAVRITNTIYGFGGWNGNALDSLLTVELLSESLAH